MEDEENYVQIKDVVDKEKFKFWNKGDWSSGNVLFKYAKTKTVYGGNYRMISDKISYGKTITMKSNVSKPILSVTKKCKNGSIHQNDWMKSGKKD